MTDYQLRIGFLEIFTMIWKTTFFLSFVLCALGKEHATSEQRFKIFLKEKHNKDSELSHIGSKDVEHHEEYAWSYPSYEFSYKVHDPKTHDIKGQEESRDGDKVKGEYWLVQPDGRKRIVKYKSNKHSGFEAAVKYVDNYHHEDKKDEKEEGDEKEELSGEQEVEEAIEEESSKNGQEPEETSNDEAPAEGGAEESADAEESDKEDLGKWYHGHHWGYQNAKTYYKGKYGHGNDKHYHGYEVYEKPAQKSENKEIESLQNKNDNKQGHKAWHGAYDKSQESRIQSAYYGLGEKRANQQPKSKGLVREHYAHPRLYRQNLSKLKRA